MRIGELFVEIGTKGGATTAKELTTIRAGLNDVKSTGLAAKAAIAAVLYELGNLSRQSMNMGQSLQQFGNLTGLSPEALQKWQYALQQSGVTAEETASTITKLQSAMADLALGKGAPDYFAAITKDVGIEPAKFRETFYVLDKLREYARAHRETPDITRNILAPLLGNNNVIQALMSGTFDPSKTPRSQLYSKNQIGALAQEKIALTNLSTEWEHFLGKLTAKHGMPIIAELADITRAVEALANSLEALNEKFGVFDGIGKFFRAIGASVLPDGVSADSLSLKGVDIAKERERRWNIVSEAIHNAFATVGAGLSSVGHNKPQVINNVNVHGSEPVTKHEIEHHVNRAVGRAFRAARTFQEN